MLVLGGDPAHWRRVGNIRNIFVSWIDRGSELARFSGVGVGSGRGVFVSGYRV